MSNKNKTHNKPNNQTQLATKPTQSRPASWNESTLQQQLRAAVHVASLHPKAAARVEIGANVALRAVSCRRSSSTPAPPFTSNDSLRELPPEPRSTTPWPPT